MSFILVLSLFYLHHLVRWQMRRGDYLLARLQKSVLAAALPDVERLASALIAHPHCPSRTRAAALRCRAWGRICSGRVEQARNDVAQALEWNPRDGRAHLVKAMAHWRTHPESALESLELAQSYRGWLGCRNFKRGLSKFRGLALSRLGRWQEAIVHLENGILAGDSFTQRYLGQALALCGRYQEALQRLQAAGEKSPRFALGLVLLAHQRPQESLFWLSQARQEKLAKEMLPLQAWAWAQLGQSSSAERCLKSGWEIGQRPADFTLYPEMTEFGRTHLAGRKDVGKLVGHN